MKPHQIATRMAPSVAPLSLADVQATLAAEVKPKAQLTPAALADRAALAAMLANWDTLTPAQLRAIVKRLVRYILERGL